MNWLIFALLAPALFSVTNFIDKFLIEKKIKDPIAITIFGGLMNLLWGIIILFIVGLHGISFFQIGLLLLSGAFLVFYIIPYFKALAIDDASRVIPLFQFVPIFSLVLSHLFLGEKITHNQFIGFIIILFGGFILGAKKLESGIFAPRKSMYFMMLSSFLYAVTGILFKYIVVKNNFWLTLGIESMGLGVGAFILLAWPPFRKRFIKQVKIVTPRVWGLLLVNDGFFTAAQFSTSFAFLLAPVALVSVVGGVQPFFILLYGLILTLWFPHIIKEEIGKSTLIVKVVSIILLFIGVYFVNL